MREAQAAGWTPASEEEPAPGAAGGTGSCVPLAPGCPRGPGGAPQAPLALLCLRVSADPVLPSRVLLTFVHSAMLMEHRCSRHDAVWLPRAPQSWSVSFFRGVHSKQGRLDAFTHDPGRNQNRTVSNGLKTDCRVGAVGGGEGTASKLLPGRTAGRECDSLHFKIYCTYKAGYKNRSARGVSSLALPKQIRTSWVT